MTRIIAGTHLAGACGENATFASASAKARAFHFALPVAPKSAT